MQKVLDGFEKGKEAEKEYKRGMISLQKRAEKAKKDSASHE